MPWHLPEDLKYFKRITMGRPVVMGRRTMESIGRPLPGRTNIVISRREGFTRTGYVVVPTFEAAIERCRGEAEEVMVIGGAQVYAEAMPFAHRIYLTELHADFEGDTRFDLPDPARWREIARDDRPKTQDHPAYSFVVYDRIEGPRLH